jgi:hypothetical protein
MWGIEHIHANGRLQHDILMTLTVILLLMMLSSGGGEDIGSGGGVSWNRHMSYIYRGTMVIQHYLLTNTDGGITLQI